MADTHSRLKKLSAQIQKEIIFHQQERDKRLRDLNIEAKPHTALEVEDQQLEELDYTITNLEDARSLLDEIT